METKVKENFKNYSEFINFIEKHNQHCETKYGAMHYMIGWFGYITKQTSEYLFHAWDDGFFKSLL